MTSMDHLFWSKGRGRGFRPQKPFSPSRKPTMCPQTAGPAANEERPQVPVANADKFPDDVDNPTQTPNPEQNTNARKYIAKFSYKANVDSPLGERELSLKLGENVAFLCRHANNDQWWKVATTDGKDGFVPAKYLQLIEKKVTSLPWLANKDLDAEENSTPHRDAKPVFKPYSSAYNKTTTVDATCPSNKAYFCGLCDKQLNGPKPYSAHLASKDHKLEVELEKERQMEEDGAKR